MSAPNGAAYTHSPTPTPTHVEPCAHGPSTSGGGGTASAPAASPPISYEVFELFAGLGGFCLSLPASLPVHALTAVEIDQRAALTYKRNLHAHASDGKDQPGQSAFAAASADHASPSGAGADAGANGKSVRSRIKENRKLFFQQQKEKLAQQQQQQQQQQAATQADSSSVASSVAVPESGAVDAAGVHAPTTELSGIVGDASTAASSSSCSASDGNGSGDGVGGAPAPPPTRLLVASTPLSSFDLPAPDLGARSSSMIQPATLPRLLLRLIEQLPASALTSSAPELRPSIWCMSPPCQPFTRTKCSKQLDASDPRSAAFLFLMRTLRSMEPLHRPRFIFLENVKHFYGSEAHEQWLDTLRHAGYSFTQYLLSPMQIGIPNHRTRYYCAAERRGDGLQAPTSPPLTEAQWEEMKRTLVTMPPGFTCANATNTDQRVEVDGEDQANEATNDDDADDSATPAAAAAATAAAAADPSACGSSISASPAVLPKSASLPCVVSPQPLHSYLDPPSLLASHLPALQLPLSLLSRGFHLSVVSPWDRSTFCFTGGYGKVVNVSSGSFLLHRGPAVDQGHALAAAPLDKSQGLAPYAGSIRFFTPMELLRLFGFPEWYRFPPHFTLVHAYKLIGNSVNISVVRLILQHHLAACLPAHPAPAATRAPTPAPAAAPAP